MKRYLHILICLLFAGNVFAQDEQVLVFRKTGEVNLFYTNTLDSVTCSCLDADSVLHEDVVSQVFWSQDTVMVVPLAEIDSIAIGERNVMEFHKDVKELTRETDLPWIVRVEENHLFYRLDTPTSILPKVNEKLFFGNSHELLPYGLAARVLSITIINGEQDVEVEPVELKDIFERLFFAGRASISQNGRILSSRRNAPGDLFEFFTLPEDLDFGTFGHLSVRGETVFTGDFVVDVLHHYYHAHIKAETEMGMEYSMQSRESDKVEFESPQITSPLPTIAWVIFPRISLSLYTSAEAELAFNYSMKRKFTYEFDWTRKDGKQTCEFIQPQSNSNEASSTDDVAKMDLTLNGEIFLGARAILDLNLPGDRVGFRADMKFGPSFHGELGIGMLTSMRNYDPKLFFKSNLSACLKLDVAASAVSHEHFLIFGNEIETPIYKHGFKFLERQIDLFPQYQHTYAMTAPRANSQQTEISVATAVIAPAPTDIETGFEIVNPQGEVVDSIFVGTIEAKPEETVTAQTFDTEIALPAAVKQEDMEGYTMRPIFHYAGYTISAAPVGIKKDVLLQPYTSSLSNGAVSFVSSGPFQGIAVANGTLYQVGTYMPVPLKDNVFKEKDTSPSVIVNVGTYIDGSDAEALVGTWKGLLNGEEVTLALFDDGTGKYNNRAIEYLLNNPQSGDLQLVFDDGDTIVLSVLSISDTKLTVIDKRDKSETICTLTRKS